MLPHALMKFLRSPVALLLVQLCLAQAAHAQRPAASGAKRLTSASSASSHLPRGGAAGAAREQRISRLQRYALVGAVLGGVATGAYLWHGGAYNDCVDDLGAGRCQAVYGGVLVAGAAA